jgi:hypothetical protein
MAADRVFDEITEGRVYPNSSISLTALNFRRLDTARFEETVGKTEDPFAGAEG